MLVGWLRAAEDSARVSFDRGGFTILIQAAWYLLASIRMGRVTSLRIGSRDALVAIIM